MGENYKELLILNNSNDAEVTLDIYSKHDPLCWLSFGSKIIPPMTKHLHRSRKSFKFKLVARFIEKRPKIILLKTQTWKEDKAFEVTESHDCIPRKLAGYSREKQICLRNLQRDKELKITSGRRNIYEILGLNMKEVRKMKKEDQRKKIKREFREQMRIWHPDKHSGDDEIAKELVVAKQLLLDEEIRARYNNEADYDEGWFSRARYKAIFRPECVTEEQKKAYRKRMKMLLASALTAAIGIAFTVGTAGLAAPGFVATVTVIRGAFAGAVLQLIPHTINKKAVVDKCDVKPWLLKGGIGLLFGAASGGINVGMTAGVVGLGEKTLSSAAVSAGQRIGIGAGTGAANGVLSSVEEEVARKFDGKNTSAALSNIGVDTVEQVVRAEVQQGGRRLRYAIAENGNVKYVSEKNPEQLAKSSKTNVSGSYEPTEADQTIMSADEECDESGYELHNEFRQPDIKNRGQLVKSSKTNVSGSYEPIEANEPTEAGQPIMSSDEECDARGDEVEEDEIENGKVKYLSTGAWFSKMIVNYTVDEVKKKQEVSGCGTFVTIPPCATQIEVSFQVRRPHWGDVMKYDRFERSWCKPYEPHVFRYDTPPIRTFTISGNLWWEAVMCVTDEHHN